MRDWKKCEIEPFEHECFWNSNVVEPKYHPVGGIKSYSLGEKVHLEPIERRAKYQQHKDDTNISHSFKSRKHVE